MEVYRMQCKFPRIGRNGSGRFGSGNEIGGDQKMEEQFRDEEEIGERKEVAANGGGGGGIGSFYGWPSSRIVRVSRASGGKDRHSKVLTSKGLRDRRVRLSVNTAIQFYDLQDRLGYDQPSKAVEWLLKAAATSIAELPPMSSPFPDTPRQVSDEKRSSTGGSDQLGLDSAEADLDGCGGDPCYNLPATKSSAACSSNSENSKNSGRLSFSRFTEKEKDQIESSNPISQTTSFTELLNGGLHDDSKTNLFAKPWPMGYFGGGAVGTPASRRGQMPAFRPMFTLSSGQQQTEIQTLSFAPEHFSVGNHNHHNHGFTISSSSGSAGFDRGTLQSNTPPSISFMENQNQNQHQHQHLLSGLHLYYGDNAQIIKGKGKN